MKLDTGEGGGHVDLEGRMVQLEQLSVSHVVRFCRKISMSITVLKLDVGKVQEAWSSAQLSAIETWPWSRQCIPHSINIYTSGID